MAIAVDRHARLGKIMATREDVTMPPTLYNYQRDPLKHPEPGVVTILMFPG